MLWTVDQLKLQNGKYVKHDEKANEPLNRFLLLI